MYRVLCSTKLTTEFQQHMSARTVHYTREAQPRRECFLWATILKLQTKTSSLLSPGISADLQRCKSPQIQLSSPAQPLETEKWIIVRGEKKKKKPHGNVLQQLRSVWALFNQKQVPLQLLKISGISWDKCLNRNMLSTVFHAFCPHCQCCKSRTLLDFEGKHWKQTHFTAQIRYNSEFLLLFTLVSKNSSRFSFGE